VTLALVLRHRVEWSPARSVHPLVLKELVLLLGQIVRPVVREQTRAVADPYPVEADCGQRRVS
jgi:hypothetical protein